MTRLDVLCTQWCFIANLVERLHPEQITPSVAAFRYAAWDLACTLAALDNQTQPVKASPTKGTSCEE